MIGYDHLHSKTFCILNRYSGGNTVITGNDHLYAIIKGLFDQSLI